jgi:hypothetical protein
MIIHFIAGTLLSVIGFCALFLGTLFFIAAFGDLKRCLAGSILTFSGIALMTVGIALLRKGFRNTPSAIRRRLFDLAAARGGALTDDMIVSAFTDAGAARAQLSVLVHNGIVRESGKKERRRYLFPDSAARNNIRHCPHCGSPWPDSPTVEACPSCGARIPGNAGRVASVKPQNETGPKTAGRMPS